MKTIDKLSNDEYETVISQNKIAIGNKPLSEITAENVMDIVLLIGACPCLDFWNKPIITDFDKETFSDTVVIDYHSTRIEDGRESNYYTFFLTFRDFSFHYTKNYEVYHKMQKHHSQYLRINVFKYLIQQGFDIPLY